MSGRTMQSAVLRPIDGGETPPAPPVPFTVPRPGRRVLPQPGHADPDAVARDARFFAAVAVVLWALIALEVAILAASLL